MFILRLYNYSRKKMFCSNKLQLPFETSAEKSIHKKKECSELIHYTLSSCGMDGTRTRDPLRDRQVF